jgi:hypothetical protein
MTQHNHLPQPETRHSKEESPEELVVQVSSILEQNQQLALQLSDLEAKMSRMVEQNQELTAQLSGLTNSFMRLRRGLLGLPVLRYQEDEEDAVHDAENWKLALQLSLARDNLYRHLEEDIPQPENSAEREKWKLDRQDVVN